MYTKILALEGELRLAFFAREDIAPGQELTYNYRFKAEEGEEKMICHCGAPNCTGYLN
jgi:histone-lysine N-methyltransferase SETD1